jgi:hypothetical protein
MLHDLYPRKESGDIMYCSWTLRIWQQSELFERALSRLRAVGGERILEGRLLKLPLFKLSLVERGFLRGDPSNFPFSNSLSWREDS